MTTGPAASEPAAGVVVPAHDEAAVIGPNLRILLSGADAGELDVVVVANGCHDDTADVARSVDGVRVLEIGEPSKAHALAVGNAASTVFPRVQVDADCRISGGDLLRLVGALTRSGAMAAAPRRTLDLAGSSWPVRAYYRVWEQLPQVRNGLFGRGVIALSEAGQERIDRLPQVMSDDLAVSEAFAPHERLVVADAVVVVCAPRRIGDLLRRRIRVATGVSQADQLGVRRPGSATSVRMLARLALRCPRLAPSVPVFLAIGVVARWRSHRAVRAGDYSTWLRDESSRAT